MAPVGSSTWEDALVDVLQQCEGDASSLSRPLTTNQFRMNNPLQSAVASLLVFGFSGKIINAHAKRLVELGAAGVILFARNYEDPEQVATLCQELKRLAAPRKLLIMIDQEGGRVSRLGPPFSLVPTARTLGQSRDPKLAKAAGWVIGRELFAVNIDMDLAPVVDVDTNPKNPVIGDRSFGPQAKAVGELASGFVAGLQSQGVAACAKHYPGHGDTIVDSHLALPHLPHSIKRLESVELPPFRKVIEAGIAAVMVAHLWTPALEEKYKNAFSPTDVNRESNAATPATGEVALTSSPHIPASLSSGPIRYLRESLGFKGVIVTDDMEMGAITKHMTIPEASVHSVQAGVDLVLACHTEKEQVNVLEALVEAFERGRIPAARLLESVNRVHELKRRYCKTSGQCGDVASLWEVVGCKEHQGLIDEMNQVAAARSMF